MLTTLVLAVHHAEEHAQVTRRVVDRGFRGDIEPSFGLTVTALRAYSALLLQCIHIDVELVVLATYGWALESQAGRNSAYSRPMGSLVPRSFWTWNVASVGYLLAGLPDSPKGWLYARAVWVPRQGYRGPRCGAVGLTRLTGGRATSLATSCLCYLLALSLATSPREPPPSLTARVGGQNRRIPRPAIQIRLLSYRIPADKPPPLRIIHPRPQPVALHGRLSSAPVVRTGQTRARILARPVPLGPRLNHSKPDPALTFWEHQCSPPEHPVDRLGERPRTIAHPL